MQETLNPAWDSLLSPEEKEFAAKLKRAIDLRLLSAETVKKLITTAMIKTLA